MVVNDCAEPPGVNWRAAMEALRGAYSEATLKSYRSDFARFEAWCLETGLRALPATPQTAARFLAADALRSASTTITRRISGIRKVHRLLGLASPVDNEVVMIALKRALRTKRRRPQQALGLNASLRDRLIAACPETLIGLRDRAMIAVGYDTLCRRSELVGLRLEDLHPLPAGGAKILVRRAKNDPYGDGRWTALSPTGLGVLNRWIAASQLSEGPILRSVISGRIGTSALSPLAVNRTIKRAGELAGLDRYLVATLSGHSMRVGAAQDLMGAGRDLLQIMTAGGWKSANAVGRYVSEADFNVWTA